MVKFSGRHCFVLIFQLVWQFVSIPLKASLNLCLQPTPFSSVFIATAVNSFSYVCVYLCAIYVYVCMRMYTYIHILSCIYYGLNFNMRMLYVSVCPICICMYENVYIYIHILSCIYYGLISCICYFYNHLLSLACVCRCVCMCVCVGVHICVSVYMYEAKFKCKQLLFQFSPDFGSCVCMYIHLLAKFKW